jgi:hypothetical protein
MNFIVAKCFDESVFTKEYSCCLVMLTRPTRRVRVGELLKR